MSRLYLPTTHTMRCFQVSAKHLSFTLAAEELNLTQSAISKQVALLEGSLQVQLFIRHRQKLELSPAGSTYLAHVNQILRKIEETSKEMLSYGAFEEVIRIASHPSLCAAWLVRALKGFTAHYGDIQLSFYEQLMPYDPADVDTDIAFVYGYGGWHGMEAVPLFDEELIPVCHPDVLAKNEGKDEIDIYFNTRLIECRSRLNTWDQFFGRFSQIYPDGYRSLLFERWSSCISAAKTGCGLALVPKVLVESDLACGTLVPASHHRLHGLGSYYMTYQKSHSAEPKVKMVRDWILTYLGKRYEDFDWSSGAFEVTDQDA